jgi:hypothetical protein
MTPSETALHIENVLIQLSRESGPGMEHLDTILDFLNIKFNPDAQDFQSYTVDHESYTKILALIKTGSVDRAAEIHRLTRQWCALRLYLQTCV